MERKKENMHRFSELQYWNQRWANGETGWDLGQVSPPLQGYFDQLAQKDLRILIPGAGNSYEAAYLARKGFAHLTVLDLAPALIKKLRKQFQQTPIQIIEGDFFEHSGEYDLIVEQTFFCALDPSRRKDYVQHVHRLLATGGKLVGVLFDRVFEEQGPPFGGTAEEYEKLFAPFFIFKTFAPCYHSHPKRQGAELFIQLVKK